MPKIPTALLAGLTVAFWSIPAGAAMSDNEKAELAPFVSSAKVT